MKHQTPNNARLLLSLAALTAIAAPAAFAGPPGKSTPPPADTGWEADMNIGFSLTRGNTDTLGLSIGLDAERRWNGWQVIGKGTYNYSEIENLVSGNALRLSLQLNRDLNDRWYLGVANAFTYDEIADLDYRYSIAAALGYRAWTGDRGELTFETGPGYTWEKQGGISDDYFTIRFAERFKYRLSENFRFIQSIEYLPEASDFGRYTLVGEAAITARLAGNLWWRIAVRDIYNSQPPLGLDENDLQLITGLSWGLGDPDSKPAAGPKVRTRGDAAKKGGDGKSAPAAPARAEGVWNTTAAIGFSLAKGNSDNLLLSGDIASSMVSGPSEYLLKLWGSYGEVNSFTTVQNLGASAQYNHSLNDRWYLGAGVGYLHDEINDVQYRITPAAILGVKLINNDTTTLRLEAGPGFTFEEVGGLTDEYFTVVARERFDHAITDTTKVWQSAEILLDPSNTDNFVLTTEVGIAFWLTDNISIRTVAQDIYDNDPAFGREENDFRLTSGIGISF